MGSSEARRFVSGNEAVALAARTAGVALATGYPGTPATEILEQMSLADGRAQWAPNEKVALEVALGAAFGGARALAVMKHVGLNVAADPFFSAAYTTIAGALVVVSADDPGMASSQNEQDNRRYAQAAGVPLLEPADSQEAYDLTLAAFELSERWQVPVLLRMTTRVCHSKAVLCVEETPRPLVARPFERDVPGRVLLPVYARSAHRRLREKLARLAEWSEASPLNWEVRRGTQLGIVASGVAALHALEAEPRASLLKLGVTYPLPVERVRRFVAEMERTVVVEEGDPYLAEQIRAAGIPVEAKAVEFRFGELNVTRVRRLVCRTRELVGHRPAATEDSAPRFCPGCPHGEVFRVLKALDCIVAGDIGCYTLGALPPFEAIDSTVCMGASIGVGLGLRHVLPEQQARRVVSVIGDSTFVHSGITGLVEMMYNPPSSGHVVIILDNGTTAMTGQQDHPGTGATLARLPTHRLDYEALARAVGVRYVEVHDVKRNAQAFSESLQRFLSGTEPAVLIARRPCVLRRSRREPQVAVRGEA